MLFILYIFLPLGSTSIADIFIMQFGAGITAGFTKALYKRAKNHELSLKITAFANVVILYVTFS